MRNLISAREKFSPLDFSQFLIVKNIALAGRVAGLYPHETILLKI